MRKALFGASWLALALLTASAVAQEGEDAHAEHAVVETHAEEEVILIEEDEMTRMDAVLVDIDLAATELDAASREILAGAGDRSTAEARRHAAALTADLGRNVRGTLMPLSEADADLRRAKDVHASEIATTETQLAVDHARLAVALEAMKDQTVPAAVKASVKRLDIAQKALERAVTGLQKVKAAEIELGFGATDAFATLADELALRAEILTDEGFDLEMSTDAEIGSILFSGQVPADETARDIRDAVLVLLSAVEPAEDGTGGRAALAMPGFVSVTLSDVD